MSDRVRVLFIAESATLAHVARSGALARGLPSDKYEVFFAADKYYRFSIDDLNCPILSLQSRPPADFSQILAERGILFPRKLIESYVEEERSLIEMIQPDVVVGDLRPSLSISAPTAKVPLITLTNAYWHPAYVRGQHYPCPSSRFVQRVAELPTIAQAVHNIFGAVFQRVANRVMEQQGRGVNEVRDKYGLPPFADYLSGFIWGDQTAFIDLPNSAIELRENQHFIGPAIWNGSPELPQWWNQLPSERPIIYLGLGSSGDISLFDSIIKALSTLPVTVVASTMGRVSKLLLPADWFVADFIPGDQITSRAALTITNGGSPATYQALASGSPVIGLPFNMDQLLSCQYLGDSGAVRTIRADLATAAVIKRTVSEMIASPLVKENAMNMAKRISELDSNTQLEDLILRATFPLGEHSTNPVDSSSKGRSSSR